MRKVIMLEGVSHRKYLDKAQRESGKTQELHDDTIKVLDSLAKRLSPVAQELLGIFEDFHIAMDKSHKLGRTSLNSDVAVTIHNLMSMLHGKRDFEELQPLMKGTEDRLRQIEQIINQITNSDISGEMSDLALSQRDVRAKKVGSGSEPSKPHTPRMSVQKPNPLDPEPSGSVNIPPDDHGPEFERWVANRSNHIQTDKEKSFRRGDTDKGDYLHSHDWWDHKANWNQASEEIKRYMATVASGTHDEFKWKKHFQEWGVCVAQAVNEYYDIKEQKEKDFWKSLIPSKKAWLG